MPNAMGCAGVCPSIAPLTSPPFFYYRPNSSTPYPTADAACAAIQAASYNALPYILDMTDPTAPICSVRNAAGFWFFSGRLDYIGSKSLTPTIQWSPIPYTITAVCPAAIPAYTYKHTTGMCERDVDCLPSNLINPNNGQCVPPETYTITLDQKSADLQPALAAANSDTFKIFVATVKDANNGVKANTPVTIKADVEQGTGGHVHADTLQRPKGFLYSDQTANTCDSVQPAACITGLTDINGQFVFTFLASQVSGNHTVTATCDVCNGGKADLAIKVAVKPELIPIPDSPLYALKDSKGVVIGAKAGTHEANHFLTSSAITKLEELAGIYAAIYPGAVLYLNDASLKGGGLLDVGSTSWSSPHSAHRKGTSLDIRAANSGPNSEGAVPTTVFKEFLKDANANKKFRLGLHCKNSTDTNYCLGQPNNRHFHVDF